MRLLIWLTQSSCGGENCHQILNTKLAPAKFEMLAVKEGRRGPAWTAVAVDLLSESFTTNITVRGFSSILTIWSFPIAGCRRRKERERERREREEQDWNRVGSGSQFSLWRWRKNIAGRSLSIALKTNFLLLTHTLSFLLFGSVLFGSVWFGFVCLSDQKLKWVSDWVPVCSTTQCWW